MRLAGAPRRYAEELADRAMKFHLSAHRILVFVLFGGLSGLAAHKIVTSSSGSGTSARELELQAVYSITPDNAFLQATIAGSLMTLAIAAYGALSRKRAVVGQYLLDLIAASEGLRSGSRLRRCLARWRLRGDRRLMKRVQSQPSAERFVLAAAHARQRRDHAWAVAIIATALTINLATYERARFFLENRVVSGPSLLWGSPEVVSLRSLERITLGCDGGAPLFQLLFKDGATLDIDELETGYFKGRGEAADLANLFVANDARFREATPGALTSDASACSAIWRDHVNEETWRAVELRLGR